MSRPYIHVFQINTYFKKILKEIIKTIIIILLIIAVSIIIYKTLVLLYKILVWTFNVMSIYIKLAIYILKSMRFNPRNKTKSYEEKMKEPEEPNNNNNNNKNTNWDKEEEKEEEKSELLKEKLYYRGMEMCEDTSKKSPREIYKNIKEAKKYKFVEKNDETIKFAENVIENMAFGMVKIKENNEKITTKIKKEGKKAIISASITQVIDKIKNNKSPSRIKQHLEKKWTTNEHGMKTRSKSREER